MEATPKKVVQQAFCLLLSNMENFLPSSKSTTALRTKSEYMSANREICERQRTCAWRKICSIIILITYKYQIRITVIWQTYKQILAYPVNM